MGDEWIYSWYRTRHDLKEGYDGREINAGQFMRPYLIMYIKETCRYIRDRVALVKELGMKLIPLEKKILGLEH